MLPLEILLKTMPAKPPPQATLFPARIGGVETIGIDVVDGHGAPFEAFGNVKGFPDVLGVHIGHKTVGDAVGFLYGLVDGPEGVNPHNGTKRTLPA